MEHDSTVQWCSAMEESGAFVSAILRVMHPEQYNAGLLSLQKACKFPEVEEALRIWPSIYHSVQVISNRETPYHRDTSADATWLDLLFSLGTYGKATFSARNLGFQMAYTTGTAVGLSSMMVHHGVAPVPPDRICYAWFMCHALHRNQGGGAVPWMCKELHPA